MKKGFTLIEILVVIFLFAIVAGIAAQSAAFSLRGARKSDSSAEVRDNLSFALQIVERQLHNAQSIRPSDCNGSVSQRIRYVDQDDFNAEFRCWNVGGANGRIASGSGWSSSSNAPRLTSNEVSLTQCDIQCVQPTNTALPPTVNITLTGHKRDAAEVDSNEVTVETQVNLRVY